jgi:hypothetical protein
VAGAILGGFGCSLELKTVLAQRERHNKFEQFANSDVVRQERNRRFPPPARLDTYTVTDLGTPQSMSETGYAAWPSEVNKEGIKDIYWSNDLDVASIQTEDGQTLYPASAPSAWLYLLTATFPILGFFVPWGVVRSIGWVGAGFTQPSK